MRLEEELLRLKEQAQKLNHHKVPIQVLRRDVDMNQQLYNMLLKRKKETHVTSGMNNIVVRLLEKATVPSAPIPAKKMRNIILAIVTGLLFGLFLAFFIEHMDNTIKSEDDLDPTVTLLGTIPSFSLDGEAKDVGPLVTLKSSHSKIAEAYRTLRTAILFSSPLKEKKKVILVTSCNTAEGKTLTSANLAIVLARSNIKTLLIDADLRKPRVHEILNIKNKKGLSSLLVDDTKIEEVTIPFKIPNLDIIPCGVVPPDPSELINSKRMEELLEEFRKRYDVVLLDSAPLLPVTDSTILGRLVDGVILVVRAGKTTNDATTRVYPQLSAVNARLIGTILNDIKPIMGLKQHYYGYYGTEDIEHLAKKSPVTLPEQKDQ